MSSQEYTLEDIKAHSTPESAYLAINNKVYDVTKFAALHPGGKQILLNQAGQDCSKIFNYFHNPSLLTNKYKNLQIGVLKQNESAKNNQNQIQRPIPWADPNYLQGWQSAYHQPIHHQLRKAIRKWVDTEIEPFASQWEEDGQIPREIITKAAQQGFLRLAVGAPWPGLTHVCGVEIQKPDTLMEAVLYEELNRPAAGGVFWGIIIGSCIGLPPILKFGSEQMRQKYQENFLNGTLLTCLGVTEPWAGSDVARIQTTAKKSECGKYYIINGLKKWITNGIFADYFTTACRTSDKGLSFILIPRKTPGVTTRKMKCQGMWSSGTTFITLEDVKVPVENLVGQEGQGFKYIMINFNHERITLCSQALRNARTCLEESMNFAHKRETFGKKLIEHPVIRNKIGNMARQVEATQAILDQICYNFDRMTEEQKKTQLSGAIAIIKVQCTMVNEFCAREAIQIFGGLGYTRGGQGDKVERIYREVKPISVGGGSEEIMLDLGMRNASKMMPKL